MHDWRKLVRQHLSDLALDAAEKEEVCAELAAHLRETCEELRRQGMTEEEAIQRTLLQVPDWNDLRRRIRSARNEEDSMNERSKCFWLPGLVGLTLSMVWLMILLRANLQLHIPWFQSNVLLLPYLLWLIAQPLIGATGAFLSRRAGGERRARLAAGLFPSFAMFGLLCWIGVMAIFAERNPFVMRHPVYFSLSLFPFVVFPGAALLLGVLPFLRVSKPQRA